MSAPVKLAYHLGFVLAASALSLAQATSKPTAVTPATAEHAATLAEALNGKLSA